MPIAYPELGFIFLDAGELSDDYTLSADGAYRNLWGNGDANRLEGNTFDNYINGDGGIDTLVGGQGNDTYRVDQPNDVITELAGEGIDTVWSNVDYTLGANVENLFLDEGGGPNITGTGNELANRITGNSGDNYLQGLGGNDTLDGGTGADFLEGGIGDDVYMVDNALDQVDELRPVSV
jgi:Ca2+-binding RTX toxin-like protein